MTNGETEATALSRKCLSDLENVCEKDYAAFMEETLQRMVQMPVSGILIDEFSSNFARRAMEDVAFYDADGNYYAVDIKTHNLSTDFNMPNLISVERLARFYRDEKKYFVILLVEYTVKNGHLSFTDTHFIPIEHLEWSCLTIGALGWGQIQIANSNRVDVNRNNTRVDWMLSLCDTMDAFYPKEINKINERIDYFRAVRSFWEGKK